MKLSVAAFGKLLPHLLAHDVSAAAVSCHFGPQSSEAEVPLGSLPLCSERDDFFFTLLQDRPSCFAPDLKWPVFRFHLFLCFDRENAEGFFTAPSLTQNINGCVLTY